MIEVVRFDEGSAAGDARGVRGAVKRPESAGGTDSSDGSESDAEASTAEPPPPVGIFVDVEDGDPLGPAEEVVLDVAIF